MIFKLILPPANNTIQKQLSGIGPAIDKGLKTLANEGVDKFENTTRTWDTDVSFGVVKQGQLDYTAGTDNEVYGYVNDGTRPHTITARAGGRLAFQSGYSAKTAPRVIGSRGGGASGDFVYAKQVEHPGTDAREFDQAIADSIQRNSAQGVVQSEINKAVR